MSKRVAAKVQDFQYQIEKLKNEINVLESQAEELRWVIKQNKVGTDQIREQLEEARKSIKVEQIEVTKMPKIKVNNYLNCTLTFEMVDDVLVLEVE